jgi:hypothetical protein
VSLVFDVLDVTGGAVWFVFRNQHSIGSQLGFSVMATVAGRAGSFTVDWIETFMATGTRQLSLRVCRNAGNGANTLDVDRVKLFTAPLFFRLSGLPLNFDPL